MRPSGRCASFQAGAGLTGTDVDGKVGARTIGLLDRALRRGVVDTNPDAPADDFRISGKFEQAAGEPRTVFFDFSSADLDAAERAKIAALATDPTLTHVTLTGMASEEGNAAFNQDLAERRAEAVAQIVRDLGIGVTARADLRFGVGDLTYRRFRAVKIELGDVPPGPVDSCAGKKPEEPCPVPFKEFTDAVTDAVKLVDDARGVLPPKDPATIGLFDTLFRTVASTRDATVPKVDQILVDLRDHVKDMPNAGAHRCANECDGICK